MHRPKNFEAAIVLLVAAMGIGTIPIRNVMGRHVYEKNVPPVPKFQGTFDENHEHQAIANRIESWTNTDKQNVWELSGLYEGDIMLDADTKNGLLNPAFRWPGGIVPYHIEEKDFDEKDVKLIKGAMEEYHNKTCIRFRPYRKNDTDYITIEGKMSGCWSLVGRHDLGQVVNLQNPGCVTHGVVVHELMHAVGFYHQQSAADRDKWVRIKWENVKQGKEHNFNKYDNHTVTDYGIVYDYGSVMHYSSHAFSSNGKPTIIPKMEGVEIGQRKGLSAKDTLKLQKMYKMECGDPETNGAESDDSSDDASIDWTFDSSY